MVIGEYIKALVATNNIIPSKIRRLLEIRSQPDATRSLSSPSSPGAPGSGDFNLVVGSPIQVEVVPPHRTFRERVGDFFGFLAKQLVVILVILAVWSVMTSQSGRGSGAMAMVGMKALHKKAKESDVRFNDVKGVDEVKKELVEIVEYLKNPSKFTALGAHLPKGVLLMGEPGTGKTLLARAVAGEASVPFLYCSGSEFDEVFVGVGSNRIRQLFEDAKKSAPCIIFIDEIDSLGLSRKRQGNFSYKDSTLHQLLTEMDGFEQNSGVIVLAATNLSEHLDSALTRPGRFDRKIHVPTPDVKGRREILEHYLSKVRVCPDINIDTLAKITVGLTGADLFNIVNQAAIQAARDEREHIDALLLEKAFDDVRMGVERKSAVISLENRRMTAYHEGGHALVAYFTEGAHPIHKATIIPRGNALGMVSQIPDADMTSFSRKQMLARLAVCMGGRAAEELIFGDSDVTGGASSDFMQANQLGERMVTQWGMSKKVGLIFKSPQEMSTTSGETRLQIETEIKELLDERYNYAASLLKQHEKELHSLANALLEKETLTGEEVTAIIKAAQQC